MSFFSRKSSASSNSLDVKPNLLALLYQVDFSYSLNGRIELYAAGSEEPLTTGTRVNGNVEITVKVIPDSGCDLLSLVVNDENVTGQLANNEYKFVLKKNTSITAAFQKAYRLTVEPFEHGSMRAILQGCYPDPSITRKGNDYYLVCSSFAMFPGVPIFHSNDLVNWKQIGHVLDRTSQLKVEDCGTGAAAFRCPEAWRKEYFTVLWSSPPTPCSLQPRYSSPATLEAFFR